MARGDTIEQVRQLAEARGVSERSVWRWFAAMNTSGSLDLLERGQLCDYCREPLPDGATVRRRFCDSTCRGNNHRDRHKTDNHPRGERRRS